MVLSCAFRNFGFIFFDTDKVLMTPKLFPTLDNVKIVYSG